MLNVEFLDFWDLNIKLYCIIIALLYDQNLRNVTKIDIYYGILILICFIHTFCRYAK